MIRLMIADDHPVFRAGLCAVLSQGSDIEVVGEASDCKEALLKAQALKPDVITMDVNMPDGTGVECTAAILQLLPDVKVLMLTVSEKDDDLFEAVKAGARGYILKDAHINEVVEAIRIVAKGEVIISPNMAGKLMTEFQVQSKKPRAKDSNAPDLTPRETEVLQLVAVGNSNKEIALALFISETTAKAHLSSILDKLHVRNRAQAVAIAIEKGLLIKNTSTATIGLQSSDQSRGR